MEKRGISHHLDWIIAMSLFMLYVVFMIVTIKPGVESLQKGPTLISIVQDNFIENVTWSITRVPLSITSHCNAESKPYIKIEFPFDWNNANTKIVSEFGSAIVEFDVSSSSLIFTNTFIETLPFTKRFYLLNSLELNGRGSSITSSDKCVDTDISYIYGVPELLTGLSEDKIQNINYDDVKNTWNYPTTNDFSISINGINKEISSGLDPPLNINVYVKQYTDFILEDSGEKVPVTVTIKVW